MRQIWIAICLATILLVGRPIAADQEQKAEDAKSKAEVLEQNASAEGSKASPSRSKIITKPEAQAVDPVGQEPLEDAITCLSRTIYWEAKSEGSEQGTCQFSWWCDGRSDDVEEEKSYTIAKEIARKALNRQLTDRTGGALYFHHRKVSPNWSAEYIKTGEIGEHIYYKPHDDSAK